MKKILLWLVCVFASISSIQAQTLYGLTTYGGKDDGGMLIKFMPATNSLTIAKSFENYAAKPYYTNFIQASDGKLYGMTSAGGNGLRDGSQRDGFGVIFSFNPSTSAYTMLKAFNENDGSDPYGSLVQASNGKLYGMTSGGGSDPYNANYGVIFSFDPSTSTYTKLMDFDGGKGIGPKGSLVQASNGKLYGMTVYGGSNSKGVIFSFDPSTSSYTKLIDFEGANGSYPYGSLIQANNGKLYGMTTYGGSNDDGVIFSFDPATSSYTKLKDFDGANGSYPYGSFIQASNGKLYSVTVNGGSNGAGVIFSFDPSTSAYTKLIDFAGFASGAGPYGSLIQASNGKLYGTTSNAGINGAGVIFSFDPSSLVYTKLNDFDITKGAQPLGSLLQASNGKLYGMTQEGGDGYAIYHHYGGNGVIFSFDPSSSTYTKLMNLDGNDGRIPAGHVIQASNGKLYGTTSNGGSSAAGTIFSFDPSSSVYTKLHDFDYANGGYPIYSLMQANDGKLYGVTVFGGSSDYGIIFSFNPSTSAFTKLEDFSNGVGGPLETGPLMQASNGKLYGLSNTCGEVIILSYDLTSSVFNETRITYLQNCGSAISPSASMVQANNGKLYGVINQYGGGSDWIFSFDPATSTYTKLHDFVYNGIDGSGPAGSLILASNGKLYGIAYMGGSNEGGVIFSFDPSTSIYTKLHEFENYYGINGSAPNGNLVQASNGKLYGMTNAGGSNGNGVIFSFDPSTSAYAKLQDFDAAYAFPYWGLGFIELKSGALPVTLISFTGKNIGNINQLTWKVENEQDLHFYELQRGIDGLHFNGIGKIKATGNNNYNYDDPIATTVSSVYYYRLKSVDKDGKFTYSPICSIRFNAASTNINISPNPVTKSIRLKTSSGGLLTGNSATATIRIYSSAMQLLQTKTISKADGNTINIPVEKLASGIYYLQLVNGSELSILKFVKE